jgi:hypothetical protein
MTRLKVTRILTSPIANVVGFTPRLPNRVAWEQNCDTTVDAETSNIPAEVSEEMNLMILELAMTIRK